jgi:hypothetical protein
MKTFAALPSEERALYWRNYSNRAGMPETINKSPGAIHPSKATAP